MTASVPTRRPPLETADYFLRQGQDPDGLAAELDSEDRRRRYIATFYTSRLWAHPGGFTPEEVAKLIKTKRPTFVVGVPTLYDALNRNPVFSTADLSCIRAAFCGADHLPRQVKEQFEAIVERQGGHVKLLEGYGLTEAVTGIMAMPMSEYREGSIGIPFPDMQAKIVKTGTSRRWGGLEVTYFTALFLPEPAGIFSVVVPSRVGISIWAPSAACENAMGTATRRWSPSRSNRLCSLSCSKVCTN